MKNRSGFVSNSSSSSFIIGTPEQLCPPRKKGGGNMEKSLRWLREGKTIGTNDGWVQYKLDQETNEVVEYGGCCEMCWGEIDRQPLDEFVDECSDVTFEVLQ